MFDSLQNVSDGRLETVFERRRAGKRQRDKEDAVASGSLMLRLNSGNDLIIELLHLDLMSSSVSPPLYNHTAFPTAGYPPAICRQQSFEYGADKCSGDAIMVQFKRPFASKNVLVLSI